MDEVRIEKRTVVEPPKKETVIRSDEHGTDVTEVTRAGKTTEVRETTIEK